MNTRRALALASTLVATMAAVARPAVRTSQGQPSPPIFRSATDVVEVDVSVQDKTGRFIDDLTAADFQLEEEGRPQAIELFSLVGTDPRSGAPQLSAGAQGGAAVRTVHRVFVVVFDDEHLTPAGFTRVQAAAETLFARHFKPGDVGGVVAGGKMANGHLTTDRGELLAAVRAARPSSRVNSRVFDERQWPRLSEIEATRIHVNNDRVVLEEAVRRACADDPTTCQRSDPTPDILAKASALTTTRQAAANAALQRIGAVLNGLTRIDGRKTVLLLSEGFVAEESWPGVEQNVGLAARANARLYTLDARGLDRGQSQRLAGADPGAEDAGARLLARLDFGADSVNSLAVDTGGFVVRNANVFDQAVERIADEAGHYYVLGYRPDRAPDARFRKISVSVKRPGAIVRARRGYVAVPRPQPVATDADPGSRNEAPLPDPRATGTAPDSEDASRRATASAETDAAATASPGVVAGSATAATSARRLRPDSLRHTEALVHGVAASDAAAASGWEAYQRGDVESARAALSAAAAGPEARPWVHYTLGQSQYALRDFSGAVASWERVRSSAPDFEPVYFDLVDGYLQTHDYDKATRLLRAAAERWPTDPEVWSALGVVQVARAVLDDAVKSFERSIALAPSEATGYFNLAKTLELRYRKTRRFVEQTRSWVSNESDRTDAIANYRRYLEIGGPLGGSARDGLARLEWK